MENGHASLNGQSPLSGWVLAILGGMTFIGRPDPTRTRMLTPVYQMVVSVQVGPQGQMAVTHGANPVLWLPSLDGLVMPESAVVVPVASLSAGDRHACEQAVRTAENFATTMRAAQAGIMAPPPNIKLPPPPSRQ